MEPQKSIVLPVTLAVLISAIVFGAGGYYLANSQSASKTATVTSTNTATTTKSTPTTATTSTTAATANWKTYTNNTYGFEVKYPTELTQSDSTDFSKKSVDKTQLKTVFSKSSENSCGQDGSCDGYSMDVTVVEGDITYAANKLATGKELTLKTISGTEGKITEVFLVGNEGARGQTAFVTKGKYTYALHFFSEGYVSDSTFATNYANYAPFLNSFKFTN